jgi:hypothetical protein
MDFENYKVEELIMIIITINSHHYQFLTSHLKSRIKHGHSGHKSIFLDKKTI